MSKLDSVSTHMPEAAIKRDVDTGPLAGARYPVKRTLMLIGLLLLVASVAWYGHRWWTVDRFLVSTDDAYVGGNVTPLAPHVAGFVQRVMVTDNSRVHAGQVLVQLDPRDYRAALEHAAAIVEAQAAALRVLQAQLVMQQSTIGQQKADLASSAASAAFAAQQATRYRTLARTVAGTQQDMQRAVALDQEGRAAVVASEAGLAAARQQVRVLNARIAEANAALAQARSESVTAKLNRGYTELKAPIDGYVGNRAAQVGAYVTAGDYLISLVPDFGLWVDANFKEDQLARMCRGQAATIVADILPGHDFHGHVLSLAPATGAIFSIIPPENATGNFTKIVQRVPVRVTLDSGDPMLSLLRPGLSTTVSIDTRREAGPAR